MEHLDVLNESSKVSLGKCRAQVNYRQQNEQHNDIYETLCSIKNSHLISVVVRKTS